MRKIFLLIVFTLSSVAFSQEFRLTENNFVSKDDSSKNYIVIDFPNTNKDQLFQKAKKYITSTYKGLKHDGYNEVLNEQIVLDVVSNSYKKMWINMQGSNLWKASNRYEINFKDNKIMIRPSFSHFENTMNNSTANIGVLFNSSGEIRKKEGFYFVEDLANTFVRDFKKGIEENKSNDW